MTKIIDGVRVLDYDEWAKIPEVKKLNDSLEDCSMCDGEGVHVCECGNEHDCELCNGDGKEENLKSIYIRTLKMELGKLLRWKERMI